MTHNKPSGIWKCRACGKVCDGSHLYRSASSSHWTCSSVFCGGTCDMVQEAKPVHQIKQATIEQLRSLGWHILSYQSAHISEGTEAIRVSYLPLFPVQYGDRLYGVPPELYNALPE